jgi:hypothetical protein
MSAFGSKADMEPYRENVPTQSGHRPAACEDEKARLRYESAMCPASASMRVLGHSGWSRLGACRILRKAISVECPTSIRWSDSTVIKASATTPIRRDPPRLVFGKQLGPAAFHEFRFQSTRSLITREPQANRNAHSRRSRLVQEAEGAQSGLQRTYAIKAAMMPTAIPSANRLINSLLVIANISLTGGRRFLRPWTIQHQ